MKNRTLLFFILFLLHAITGSGQVTAGFTASPTTGCPPLLVHFTNTTSPAAGTTYSWTFGPSSTSTLTNPSSSFTSAGVHVVTLVATNGSSVSTYTLPITVYPTPTVSFVADDSTPCPGQPVNFTSTSIPGVVGAVTYSWSFGDGGTGTGNPISHAYTSTGSYMVTLFVTNAMGCTSSYSWPAYIDVMPRPTAAGTWTPPGGCNPPVSIAFTSTSLGTGPMTAAWTYGDGGSGTGSPATHNYTSIGTYSIKLVITDANGCVDSAVLGSVHIDTIHASFTGPDTVCVSQAVSFTNTSTTHTSRTWNYGDGGSSGGITGAHTYSLPGTYTVTLNISNPPCSATATRTIVVLPGPNTNFTISPANPCPAPVTVTYTATGGGSTGYSWLFDGASGGTGSPVSYTWTSNGIKTIKMIETNPATGCVDTVVKKDTLYDLEIDAAATPHEGCVPLTVFFSSNVITHVPYTTPISTYPYPFPVTSYSWDYGDGTPTGSGSAPTHTYTAVGVYYATVTATTANGCTTTDTVRIDVGAPPQVTFTATPTHFCYSSHYTVIFDPTIIVGPVDEYHWEYGDANVIVHDTTAGGLPTAHTYSVPGTFTVTVTPYWRGCPGVPYTIADYIVVDSPKAIISYDIPCSPGTRGYFYDSSMGDDTHLWIFSDDGSTSTADTIVHDFPGSGTYTVTLTTYNIRSGCRDTTQQIITIDNPVVNFTTSTPVVCLPSTITFTMTVTGGSVAYSSWFVDGAGTYTTTGTTYTRNFNTLISDTGYHTIMLVTHTAAGCTDTVIRNNYVYVSHPIASFTVSPTSGCAPLTSTFTSTSTHTSASSIVSYLWRFYDGGPDPTSTPVTRTYTSSGTFSVRLIVTDVQGCMDSILSSSAVTVYQPHATFTASNVTPCIGAPVTFTITTPSVTSATWDFGDGTTSTATTGSHSYAATGSYNIHLSITDSHGCTADTTYMAYINVSQPTASFTMSDSISVCPPLTVAFTNTSVGATSYGWTFGDGGTSSMTSPSNMYIVPGLYNVRMIATDSHGCRDTAVNIVNIFGYAGAFTYSPTQGCAPLTVHFSSTLANVPFITWDFSDGVTSAVSFSDTITHIYTTPGAYVPKLLLSDNTGCQASSVGTDTIFVDAIYPKMGTNPSPVCEGIPFNFVDSSTSLWSPIDTWLWTYDGNTSTISNPSYLVNTPGTYPVTLHVSNAWGCTGDLTGEFVVYPPPVVTASKDTLVCLGDPARLTGYGAVTYEWADGATLSCTACNPTYATPATPTVYTVTGTDAYGCTDTATVTVTLRTHTYSNPWGDTSVCAGYSVQLHDTGGSSYLWIPSTGLNSNTTPDPIASPPYTVVYTVVATLAGCLPDTQTVVLGIYPLPTVDAGPDQRVLAGSEVQLQAVGTDIATLEWWPNESLSCADCPNPVTTMTVNTTFHVDVASSHGCRASDTTRVIIYCDNSMVFIPNSFTPNGDGKNDVFYPRGQGLKVIKTFRIYNRWGELLFEKDNFNLNDEQYGWDGSYKGDIPKPDVYVYLIEAVCYTGDDVFIKGDVTIIR